MAELNLESFYNFIAFGEFDEALEYIQSAELVDDGPEKVIIQALKLKKQLQKYLCPESVKCYIDGNKLEALWQKDNLLQIKQVR